MGVRQSSPYTAEQVIDKLGVDFKKFGALYRIQCYNSTFHNNGDATPSLTIYDYDRGYFCYSCSESGSHSWLLHKFGVEDEAFKKTSSYSGTYKKKQAEPPKPAAKTYQTYDLDAIYDLLSPLPPEATEVLEAKGFGWKSWEDVAGWRWHTNQVTGWPAGIFIPYYDGETIVSARIRCLEGPARFLGLPGGETFPFQLNNLQREHAFVCEGESDTMTMVFQGFPAVGVPGSTNTNAIEKIVSRAAETGCKLTVVPDQDKAGMDFLDRMRVAAFKHRVPIDVFMLPGYKDVNEWFVSVGQEVFDNTLIKQQAEGLFAELPPIYKQKELNL